MSLFRMGVVGVGALGQHHARILSELDGVELVAVADNRPEQGSLVAERLGCQHVLDAADLIGRVDAVSIAAPTSLHHAIATQFLNHQIPVMIEKPLAATVEQAQELVELADAQSTLLQVGHIERFNPATQAAAPYIESPRYIRAERVSPFTFRSTDIGVVHDLMIHDIDLVLSIVNSPIASLSAFGVAVMGPHDDCVQARLTFQNGCIADLTASRVHPQAARHQTIWSSAGCTNIDFTTREVVHYSPSDRLRFGTPPVDIARRPGADLSQLKSEVFGQFIDIQNVEVKPQDALTAELSHFVESVENQTPPLVDGHAGLAAMEVAAGILESMESHRWDGADSGRVGPNFAWHQPHRMAG